MIRVQHTEDHDQLIWRFATEELDSAEIGLIEERQSQCEECARALAELEQQREDERRRREKKSSPASWILLALVAAAAAALILWVF